MFSAPTNTEMERNVLKDSILPYLCRDRGSARLATFSLFAGKDVKMVHRMLVASLVPGLPDEVDGIILPAESSAVLNHLLTFLYCGR